MNVLSLVVLIAGFVNGKATELTLENFETFLKENENVLVKFYAPWCGHCKKMAPEFDDAADKLEGKAVLAKIDVNDEKNKPLADKYGVKGFPTLKFFPTHDTVIDYTGGRTSSQIIDWIGNNTGEAVTEVDGADDVPKERVVLSYCGDSEGATYSIFKKTAESNRGQMGFVSYKGCKVPEVKLHRVDGTNEEVTETKQEKDIMEFVKMYKLGYFEPIGPENARDYSLTGLTTIYFGATKEEYEELKNMVEKVAKNFRDKYIFTFLDRIQYEKQAEGMLRTTTFPAFVLPMTDRQGSYRLDEKKQFTDDGLTKWIRAIIAGDVEPILMSEPIPEVNDEPVKVVVGKTFKEMVSDDKDVLLEIYAPWCGVCKKFKPTYDELAEHLATLSPETLVAKIDGSNNDIPVDGYKFSGFPTIYFKKAGGKPELYGGDRSLDGIMEYLLEKGSHDFKWETTEAPKMDEL